MFAKTAAWYDAIYDAKDYAGEALRIDALIRENRTSVGNALLDVACGTGRHLAHLASRYEVEGLDLDSNLLAIARERLPDVALHQGDMTQFALGRRFDAITCLFSSIAYTRTTDRMWQAVRTFQAHLAPGGVLLLEPWLQPEQFIEGYLSAELVDRPELKVARLQRSTLENRCSVLNFSYLIGTPEEIVHFNERHELGLFSHQQILDALHACKLEVHFDAAGLIGRGLYIACKPESA